MSDQREAGLHSMIDLASYADTLTLHVQQWFDTAIWSGSNGLQLALILLCAGAGWVLAKPVRLLFLRGEARLDSRWFDRFSRACRSVRSASVIWLLLQATPWLNTTLAQFAGIEATNGLLRAAHNLLGAWIIIRFFAGFIEYPFVARWLAALVWMVAALSTLGWLDTVVSSLDNYGFTAGDLRISLLTVIKGLVAFAAVMWVANLLARLSESQIQRMHHLTPSLRVLISKVLRVCIIVLAVVVGLNTIGIDLTSLAVFSGAVGVGLGFGLQKVVSNFISGIILLLDRSIKPGDVIAIEDTYGWVNKLSARHASVITRDGKEHLIPNELLITERVENWSYSDRNIRLKIPVGVSYNSDPRQALALMKEAAAACPRVLKSPAPRALMLGFGDSSLDLELRCWIDDPTNGIRNITSEVLLLIWDKFHEHGIEIPFPQRDVHIKSGTIASGAP